MTSEQELGRTLTVSLGERSYNIFIGPGLVDQAGAILTPILKQQRTFVVSDNNVAPLYLERLLKALGDSRIKADSLVLPAGESTKDFAHLERVVKTLLSAKVERATTLIALGGGVIGDLTGFAAAIVLRGIDFVQIPTTLLAQVDSSVGGKTGINTPQGKNLAGSFHQPIAVLADIDVLRTLSDRERLAGYAEVCKYGLIGDKDFWHWLEENGEKAIAGDPTATVHAVETSCAAKARIVAEDERESGKRALLNLGHTFAHALEAEVGYSGILLHGEAVAIGMVMAFTLSARLGLCSEDDAKRVRSHFESVGLPVAPPRQIGAMKADTLLAHMAQDKKVQDGDLTFVLARGIGEAFLTQDVSREDLVSILEAALAA